MKYTAAIALAPILAIAGCGASLNATKPAQGNVDAASYLPAGNWNLTFDDEFNDTKLDTTKWTVDVGVTCGQCLADRQPGNVSVQDGYLQLKTTHVSNADGKEWTTGGIESTFTQQYGYFEARVRYANAPGIDNAFWMFTPTGATKNFEIDANEGVYANEINNAFHDWTNGDKTQSYSYTANTDLANGFHVYGVEWTPDTIIYYFDGMELWRTPNTVANGAMKLELTTMVLAGLANPTNATDGAIMSVDYARVYTQD